MADLAVDNVIAALTGAPMPAEVQWRAEASTGPND
jgi:hypothetical protein